MACAIRKQQPYDFFQKFCEFTFVFPETQTRNQTEQLSEKRHLKGNTLYSYYYSKRVPKFNKSLYNFTLKMCCVSFKFDYVFGVNNISFYVNTI